MAQGEVSPELTAAQSALHERRDALDAQSLVTSNPQISVQPGFRKEGTAVGPEGQLTVTQSIQLGGLGHIRKELFRRELIVQQESLAVMRKRRRLDVSQSWLSVWSAQVAERAAEEAKHSAWALVDRLERAAAQGGFTKVDVATARAFAAEATALQLEWEGQVVERGTQLARLLGLDHIVAVSQDLPLFESKSFAAVSPKSETPELRAANANLEAEQERISEVKAQWVPQLQLSLQGGHESPGQWFGNVGVGATIPAFERGAREQAVHRAQVKRLEGEVSRAASESRLFLEWAEHELQHAEQVFHVVHDIQWPEAQRAAQLETRRFDAGEATLIELVLIQKQANQAHIAALIAHANLVLARARLQEIAEAR